MKENTNETECLTCQSLEGEIKLAPGPVIYEGQYWQIEHVAPTAIKGWLVIILKRHASALHELSNDEFSELAILSRTATKLLFQKLECEKEYMACFAEGEGFKHIHIHVIPKAKDFLETYIGPNIFQALGPKVKTPVTDETIQEICLILQESFKAELEKER